MPSKRIVTGRLVLALATLGVALAPSVARAALEEVLSTSSADVSTLVVAGQPLRVRARGPLKEFAGPNGKVFSADFTGRVDIQALLGSHYAAYVTALRARRPGGHNHLLLVTPELVVDVHSFMGRTFGHVHLPQSLPKGVTIDALR